MRAKHCVSALLLLSIVGIAGCANDGTLGDGGVTTSSIVSKPQVDPACVALSARIDGLKQDGSVGRVEKAAAGKSKTVSIKRASLGKVAELNQANSEFQAKCSTVAPQRGASGASTVNPAAEAVANRVAQKAAGSAVAAAKP